MRSCAKSLYFLHCEFSLRPIPHTEELNTVWKEKTVCAHDSDDNTSADSQSVVVELCSLRTAAALSVPLDTYIISIEWYTVFCTEMTDNMNDTQVP